MQTDRKVFIQDLFRFLSKTEYLWLKAILNKPEDTPPTSDLDLFLHEKDVASMLLFIAENTSVNQCEIKQKTSVTHLYLRFSDGTQLQLDLLTALVRKQFCYLTKEYLIANKTSRNGVVTYSTMVLLEHVLLFNFLNHAGLPPKYVSHFSAMSNTAQARLLGYINDKYKTAFTDFREMAVFSKNEQKRMVEYLKRRPENSLTTRSLRAAKHLINEVKAKFNLTRNLSTPRLITFSGVDGAGKTTLLNDLRNLLSTKFNQRVVVLRHRPSVLPMLSAYAHGKEAAEARAAATLPRQGNNQSTFSSLLRFGYYFADYLFGQVYVWFRYLLTGHTVIYDRYYFDFIVDGKRSNISLGQALPKWLYRFVAKPGLNIFLYADADTIRQRKQEIPKADIEVMTQQYLSLFEALKTQYGGKYICIENHDRTATLHTILAHCFSINNDLKINAAHAQGADKQEFEPMCDSGNTMTGISPIMLSKQWSTQHAKLDIS